MPSATALSMAFCNNCQSEVASEPGDQFGIDVLVELSDSRSNSYESRSLCDGRRRTTRHGNRTGLCNSHVMVAFRQLIVNIGISTQYAKHSSH